MNKFLIVGLVLCGGLGWVNKSEALPVGFDSYRVVFTGKSGADMHGSIVWTDVRNLQRPSQLEAVNGKLPITLPLELPAGSKISATASTPFSGDVTIHIFHNKVECDDAPAGSRSADNVKTCTP
jgi:hypothetical protein